MLESVPWPYTVSKERFLPFSTFLPSSSGPVGTLDRDAIEAELDTARASLKL